MAQITRIQFRLAATLVFLLAVGMVGVASSDVAHAQPVDALRLPGDLSLVSLYERSGQSRIPGGPYNWKLRVKNDGPTTANLVKVRLEYTADYTTYVESVGTEIWTIHALPSGHDIEKIFRIPGLRTGHPNAFVPLRLYAEIIDSDPVEQPGFEFNNVTEQWAIIASPTNELYYNHGDAGVRVTSISDRFPQLGGTTTFGIRPFVELGQVLTELDLAPHNRARHGVEGVQIEVSLSPGLVFAGVPQGPDGTMFNMVPGEDIGVWDVGAFQWLEGTPLLLMVTVNLTADSLEDVPLNRRCLTAKVVRAVPRYVLYPTWQENDTVTACLGVSPKAALVEGEIFLWTPYDCLGVTGHPCGGVNELKLFLGHKASNSVEPGFYLSGVLHLEPESLIVQVRDSEGRRVDMGSHSVTSGSVVSWQTGQEVYSRHPGVRIGFSMNGFKGRDHLWRDLVRTVSVSGLDGSEAPGNIKVRNDVKFTGQFASFSGSTLFDPNAGPDVKPPWTLSAETADISQFYFFEFEKLGTYVVNFSVLATHIDGTTHSDSDNYTFHVGPISELEVRDGGASPLAARGQKAYTILAANNGPDVPPEVRVTLSDVPQGSEAVLTDGSYWEGACDQGGLCAGTWDIGPLSLSNSLVADGRLEYPTLTLIPPSSADAPASITASIENTQDYSVTIDGTTHSTHYFDYDDSNDTDIVIEARRGTGAGDPGTPKSPRVRLYEALPSPPIALVSWDRVEQVNSYQREHYEVIGFAPPCDRPARDAEPGGNVRDELYLDTSLGIGEERCYAVRAVNDRGVAGYWSSVVSTRVGGPPRSVTVSKPSLTVTENEGTDSYTVVLDSQPTAPVRVAVAIDDPAAARLLSPSTLVFDTDDWNRPQTVRVAGVDDERDNPNNRRTATIRHTAEGGGYDGVDIAPVVVTVTDDDGPGVTVSTDNLAVAENGGEGSYTIVLNTQPNGPVQIDLSTSNDKVAEVNPPRLTFDTNNWDQPRTVKVTGVNDDVDNPQDRRTATIDHTISGGAYGDVEVPSVTVTVVDDDGPDPGTADPGITLSESGLTVEENGPPGSYAVVLNSEPTGPVRIDLSSLDPNIATVRPAFLRFTTTDWNRPQRVTVTAVDDDVVNPKSRRTMIEHAVSGGGYGQVSVEPVEITVADDDRLGITVSKSALTLTDDGSTEQYTVRLNTRPTGPVTVNVTNDDDWSSVEAHPTSLTFGVKDWDIPIVVTVTGRNDNVDNPGDRRETILRHASSGGGYDSAEEQTLAVTVTDDDTAGLSISETRLHVPGGGGMMTYTVKLGSKPTHDVTVHIVNGDRTLRIYHEDTHHPGGIESQGGLTHKLFFTPSEWNTEKTVRVRNVGGTSGTHTLRHRTFSEDDIYNDKSWPDLEVQRVSKPKVSLSAGPSPVTVGDPAEFTVSIEGGPLPYDLTVTLYTYDSSDVLVDDEMTVTMEAGFTQATASFATQNGSLSPPDYRCRGGVVTVRMWVDESRNFTSDNAAGSANVEVQHRETSDCT